MVQGIYIDGSQALVFHFDTQDQAAEYTTAMTAIKAAATHITTTWPDPTQLPPPGRSAIQQCINSVTAASNHWPGMIPPSILHTRDEFQTILMN